MKAGPVRSRQSDPSGNKVWTEREPGADTGIEMLPMAVGASWHYHHPERMGIAQPSNEVGADTGVELLATAVGASWHYHHPERMGIAQPRVARNELPWGSWSNVSYP